MYSITAAGSERTKLYVSSTAGGIPVPRLEITKSGRRIHPFSTILIRFNVSSSLRRAKRIRRGASPRNSQWVRNHWIKFFLAKELTSGCFKEGSSVIILILRLLRSDESYCRLLTLVY